MHPSVTITAVDPRHDPRVAPVLRTYLREVEQACGINGEALDAAVADVGDYVGPTGAFLVADAGDGTVIGCVAVRTWAPGIGELKRMWVEPAQRGRGLGRRLLGAIEERALGLGLTTMRLDTHDSLAAALALYRQLGYEPIGRYNGNSDATQFLERRLDQPVQVAPPDREGPDR